MSVADAAAPGWMEGRPHGTLEEIGGWPHSIEQTRIEVEVSRITVEPASLTFEVEPGESILAAALRAGIRWPTVCKGVGACKTCYLVIRSGAEHFSPLTALEQQELVWVRRRHQDVPAEYVRLACQVNVSGDATVFCKGARAAAAQVPTPEGPLANPAGG